MASTVFAQAAANPPFCSKVGPPASGICILKVASNGVATSVLPCFGRSPCSVGNRPCREDPHHHGQALCLGQK
ncbi:unnamed protein product [Zymoseptoria tritici ST99CH_1A5]|nr:unnamed protein product [Zymoseptoria tritici ST99CH_3D1]SMY28447.1 unnamed protein product [Zymoseptoria tritici ST99CH_1A5]